MSGSLVTDEADALLEYSNPDRPLPLFVAMSTAPFAGWEPETAAAGAARSTVTSWMSAGGRKLSGSRPAERPPPAPVPTGTPSITYSGSLLAFTDVAPRILIDKPPPGSLLSTTCTPATLL